MNPPPGYELITHNTLDNGLGREVALNGVYLCSICRLRVDDTETRNHRAWHTVTDENVT